MDRPARRLQPGSVVFRGRFPEDGSDETENGRLAEMSRRKPALQARFCDAGGATC